MPGASSGCGSDSEETLKKDDLDAEQGTARSIKYICTTFLDDDHYSMLHQTLSKKWSSQNSLSAAVRLMEQYGVTISPQELEQMSAMDEADQINCLVTKMPQQSNEQFQHFFLQLQLLVSTAARLRRGIEEGQPDDVEQALNDADNTGICPYILKMSIVQAGTEVASVRKQYETWVKDADAKMAKLVRGSEDAMQAQKRLAEGQGALQQFVLSQSDRVKRVLARFATSSDSAFRTSVFHAWREVCKQLQAEKEIREEYEDQIASAKARILAFKSSQIASVRKMLHRKAETNTKELILEVLRAWHDGAAYEKDLRLHAGQVAKLQDKLKSMCAAQAANSKKVLERLNQGSDSQLQSSAFTGWLQYFDEVKKQKDMAAVQAEADQKLKAFMEEKAKTSKKMLQALFSATESGCKKNAFEGWRDIVQELQYETSMEKVIGEQKAALGDFSSRSKKSSNAVMEKASVQQDQTALLRCLYSWRLFAQIERTLHIHHSKIEAKRMQLMGVQQMFRGFASQLEAGIRDGSDSSRDLAMGPPPRQKRGLQRNDGTVSLPDINASRRTPTSGYGPADDGPAPPPRQAW